MSFAYVLTPVSFLDAQGISPTAKIVYQRLMSHLNRKTGQCNPKFSTLARELGVSYRTIQRAIKALCNNGLVRTIRTRASSAFELLGVKSRLDRDVHSRLDTDGRSRLDTDGHFDDSASLLTEPDEMNNRVGPAAAVNASESIGPLKAAAPAAAAGSFLSVSENPKINTAAPEQMALALREPQAINFAGLARAIGERLIAVHPSPGLPLRAFPLIEAILRNAPDPEATGEKLWNNHGSWRHYWNNVPMGRMIPQLWRWLESGEWEFPPVLRKGMLSETAEADTTARILKNRAEYDNAAKKVADEIASIIARGRAAAC